MMTVLVADDSGFMRLALRQVLQSDPGLRVIAEAASGDDAVRLTLRHRPDVVTMDVEMPGTDGVAATRRIMAELPTPVIMVSSLTRGAALTTIKALDAGAVDYVPKGSALANLDIAQIERELRQKIAYWATHPLPRPTASAVSADSPNLSRRRPVRKPELVVIGASTGGPRALPELLLQVQPLACPVVIALHMPPLYTESFAAHLASATGHAVVEGVDGMFLRAGQVVVAPGGVDSMVRRDARGGLVLRIARQSHYGIHPSVDALFLSVAETCTGAIGVVMTGMGEDGKAGALEFARLGFPVLAQDRESSLVHGMPKAVIAAGAASDVLDIAAIGRRLGAWAG